MKTYQVTLPDETAAFVDRVMAEKLWDSLDHLMQYALNYVETELENDKHQDIDALRKAIQVGIDQADRGETAPLDLDDIWARVQQRLADEQEAAHAAGDASRAG